MGYMTTTLGYGGTTEWILRELSQAMEYERVSNHDGHRAKMAKHAQMASSHIRLWQHSLFTAQPVETWFAGDCRDLLRSTALWVVEADRREQELLHDDEAIIGALSKAQELLTEVQLRGSRTLDRVS